MSKMQELYEKVAADNKLQEKFAEIMKEAEADGEEATKEKLTEFAKETGYDVTVDEMREFFEELSESKNGELSDLELDQVAGGKSTWGILAVVGSVGSFGFTCVVGSLAIGNLESCKELYK